MYKVMPAIRIDGTIDNMPYRILHYAKSRNVGIMFTEHTLATSPIGFISPSVHTPYGISYMACIPKDSGFVIVFGDHIAGYLGSKVTELRLPVENDSITVYAGLPGHDITITPRDRTTLGVYEFRKCELYDDCIMVGSYQVE